ncbi:MAG TPA: proline dehydrogenase family protein [Gemmatimonadales bacterium]|nr:proline dehydrogenase family protein [Gemmatimonadales bacterium]
MLRAGLIWLSERPTLCRLVRGNGFARRFASRFVAGETLEDGLTAVRALNAAGISATLDLLGESVREAALARAARDLYLRLLDRLRETGLDSNVSIKLTQMGLDIDEAWCVENLRTVLERARRYGSFVRIDMEQSAYTDRTLRLFTERLYPEFGDAVGVVLQSALRRTARDLENLIALGARVRLCKGAYREPPEIAFPRKRDVDAAYVAAMERLLERGNYPALATHDERIIRHAQAFARRHGIGAERFEFQMLYGVRRDLQAQLRREGWRVRVYVPFGAQWYPYLMRRLAERPANVAFIAGNLLKEWLRRP